MRAFIRIVCVLLAAALLVAGVLVVVEVIVAATGSDPLVVKWHGFSDVLARNEWKTAGPRIAAIVLIVVGLFLLLFGLRRGKPANLALVPLADGVDATTTRRSVQRSLAHSATDIDGVADAKVKVKRRKVVVRAVTTSGAPRESVSEALTGRMDERIEGLGLAGSRRLKVKLTVPPDKKAPEPVAGVADVTPPKTSESSESEYAASAPSSAPRKPTPYSSTAGKDNS